MANTSFYVQTCGWDNKIHDWISELNECYVLIEFIRIFEITFYFLMSRRNGEFSKWRKSFTRNNEENAFSLINILSKMISLYFIFLEYSAERVKFLLKIHLRNIGSALLAVWLLFIFLNTRLCTLDILENPTPFHKHWVNKVIFQFKYLDANKNSHSNVTNKSESMFQF